MTRFVAQSEITHPLFVCPQVEMLTKAQRYAQRRVVVKRPKSAEPLGGIAPSHSVVGSTNRFDVYLAAARVVDGPGGVGTETPI